MQFAKAKKVKVNTVPNHKYHNLLARAINQRIISGIGDSAWRIFYYAYSTFRGVRNPQDSSFPAQDEWFKFYANIEPKMAWGKFGWPEVQAGEAQGANVANPFMAWIFGNKARTTKADGTPDNTKDGIHGYWSEPIRLGGLEIAMPRNMPRNISGDPNLNTVWYDCQLQRGCAAFIPNYKYLQRNALTPSSKELSLVSLGITSAARRHLRYVTEALSMGRYAPSYVPKTDGKGGVFRKKNAAKDQIEQAIFYYLSYFRGTEDQRAKHNLSGKDVTVDGFDFETFFSRQFLLAPSYSKPKYELNQDGSVKKDNFGNNKIKYDSFGYPELFPEGTASFYWSFPLSFDNQENIIQTQDNNTFYFSGNTKQETVFNTNPNPSVDKNRFCLSAIFIQTSDIAVKFTSEADSLLNGLFIDIYVNKTIYESVPILPEDKYKISNRTGVVNDSNVSQENQYRIYQFNKIHYFKYPVKGGVTFKVRGSKGVAVPTHKSFGTVSLGYKIKTPQTAQQNFSIFIKFAHVLEMKPSAADAYVMMRVATTEGMGTDAGQMDPVGHFNCDSAKTVFTNYIRYGVAYNFTKKTLYQNDAYVSANPVYESTRKFISSNIRMADRVSLVDYEINSSGKSVLYFNRYAMGMKNTGIDIFRNLGPSITEVGNRSMIGSKIETFIPIYKGKSYIVLDLNKNTSNYIIYVNKGAKVQLKHGSLFVGGDYYYVSQYSDPSIGVYELDGIVDSSFVYDNPKADILVDKILQTSNGNISNEWTMFMSYNLYHPSSSSPWKPTMYGDIMGALNARCLTGSKSLFPNARTSRNVKKHLASVSWRPNDLPLVVEGPSGYNYIESANSSVPYSDWIGEISTPNKFSNSCSIYQAPYIIESVTRVNPFDPKSDLIKVTLNTRLRSADSLERYRGKISEDLEKWNYGPDNEKRRPFRTDENAVIDYLIHILTGQSCPRGVIGDVAMNNQSFWSANRPFGCCYPRFYFVKLIPEVSASTVMYSDHYRQIEYYLRAMCNGFVNKNSEMSAEEVIAAIRNGDTGLNYEGGLDSAIGDYLFEDLMKNSYDNSSKNNVGVTPNVVGRQ